MASNMESGTSNVLNDTGQPKVVNKSLDFMSFASPAVSPKSAAPAKCDDEQLLLTTTPTKAPQSSDLLGLSPVVLQLRNTLDSASPDSDLDPGGSSTPVKFDVVKARMDFTFSVATEDVFDMVERKATQEDDPWEQAQTKASIQQTTSGDSGSIGSNLSGQTTSKSYGSMERAFYECTIPEKCEEEELGAAAVVAMLEKAETVVDHEDSTEGVMNLMEVTPPWKDNDPILSDTEGEEEDLTDLVGQISDQFTREHAASAVSAAISFSNVNLNCSKLSPPDCSALASTSVLSGCSMLGHSDVTGDCAPHSPVAGPSQPPYFHLNETFEYPQHETPTKPKQAIKFPSKVEPSFTSSCPTPNLLDETFDFDIQSPVPQLRLSDPESPAMPVIKSDKTFEKPEVEVPPPPPKRSPLEKHPSSTLAQFHAPEPTLALTPALSKTPGGKNVHKTPKKVRFSMDFADKKRTPTRTPTPKMFQSVSPVAGSKSVAVPKMETSTPVKGDDKANKKRTSSSRTPPPLKGQLLTLPELNPPAPLGNSNASAMPSRLPKKLNSRLMQPRVFAKNKENNA